MVSVSIGLASSWGPSDAGTFESGIEIVLRVWFSWDKMSPVLSLIPCCSFESIIKVGLEEEKEAVKRKCCHIR